MATMQSVREISRLGEDMPVQGIRGFIRGIEKRYSGFKKDKQPWSLQKMTLQDRAGDSIVLQLDSRDPAEPEWLGKELVFTSEHGPKGWVGLRTKTDTYKDKETFLVKVTPRATIELADASPSTQENTQEDHPPGLEPPPPDLTPKQKELMAMLLANGIEPDIARKTALKQIPAESIQKGREGGEAGSYTPPQKDAPAATQGSGGANHAAPSGGPTAIGGAKVAALQGAVLYVLALDAAMWVKKIAEAKHRAEGFVMTLDQFQAMTSSLFIQLDKQGWAMRMPNPPKEWTEAVEAAEAEAGAEKEGGAA